MSKKIVEHPTITVRELIKILNIMNPDALVVFTIGEQLRFAENAEIGHFLHGVYCTDQVVYLDSRI
jgi:hypothetical protein